MDSVASPGSAKEALGMMTSAMSYLSAADVTQMAAETQAQCLQALERVNAMGTRHGPRSWGRSPPGNAIPRTRTTVPERG
jgi:hypothetical protein